MTLWSILDVWLWKAFFFTFDTILHKVLHKVILSSVEVLQYTCGKSVELWPLLQQNHDHVQSKQTN